MLEKNPNKLCAIEGQINQKSRADILIDSVELYWSSQRVMLEIPSGKILSTILLCSPEALQQPALQNI